MKKILATLLVSLACISPASAATIVGGIAFDDDAFVDDLLGSVGAWTFGGGAVSLEGALVGSNANDFAFCFGSSCQADLSFVDNLAVNLAGADLAVFELGTSELFALRIGATTQQYTAVDTGFDAGGFNLLVALIDLTDFGVAAGGTVNTLSLFPAPTGADPADFTVIGAVNSVTAIPEPATLTLVALGLAGIRYARQQRRRS